MAFPTEFEDFLLNLMAEASAEDGVDHITLSGVIMDDGSVGEVTITKATNNEGVVQWLIDPI